MAGKKFKLSARNLADLPAGQIAWDTDVAGFGARGSAKGQHTLFLNYQNRSTGKYHRVTIGKLGELSVDAARKRAAQMRLEIRAGVDVAQKVETAAARQASGETLAHVVHRWLDAPHAWGPTTKATYARCMKRELLGTDVADLRISDVTRANLMRLVDTCAARSESSAVLLLRVLKSFLAWCESRDLCDVTLPSSRRAEIAVPERTRVLTDDEVWAIWRSADAMPPNWAACGRLIWLTAQRSGAVAALDAAQVRQDGVTFHNVARTKRACPWVPLTPWAWEIVREGLAEAGRLFTHTKVFGHSHLARWRDASGVTDWRLHDARRNFKTWAAAQGVDDLHSEAALGHTVQRDGLARAYQHHTYEAEAAEALRAWQLHLEKLAT